MSFKKTLNWAVQGTVVGCSDELTHELLTSCAASFALIWLEETKYCPDRRSTGGADPATVAYTELPASGRPDLMLIRSTVNNLSIIDQAKAGWDALQVSPSPACWNAHGIIWPWSSDTYVPDGKP
jgi:hypothetical protein